jgi:hypothetical protein
VRVLTDRALLKRVVMKVQTVRDGATALVLSDERACCLQSPLKVVCSAVWHLGVV